MNDLSALKTSFYSLIISFLALLSLAAYQINSPIDNYDIIYLKDSIDQAANDYFQPNKIQQQDWIYQKNIRTILLYVGNDELSEPALPLNGNWQLTLKFDDLEGDVKDYSYRLIHCTADWQVSDLEAFDYMDGFTEEDVTYYDFSQNTLQTYTHYTTQIPANGSRITKSGNYLLQVYEADNEEQLAFTRRFVVFENKVVVEPRILSANISQYFDTHQRINFTLYLHGFPLNNPIAEIYVRVLQNGRWDNSLTNLQPTFVKDKELVYDHNDINLFEAGNEFRYLNIKSLRFLNARIDRVAVQKEQNHIYLRPDYSRKDERFLGLQFNYQDFNGKYRISLDESVFDNLDADYAKVHFVLPTKKPITTGNIYLIGGFNHWQTLPENQLHYNEQIFAYEGQAYLKQGYYDYQYTIVEDEGTNIPKNLVEGNYRNTENSYQVLVYHRGFGSRYDRLIAYKIVNTLY